MYFYQHNIGDFDRATRHLNRLERSIYRDLLDLYYDTEKPLTLDREKLCRRIIARTNEEVTAVEQVLNEFFTETANGWYQDRCEAEIAAYRANSSQRAKAGKASAEARKARKQQAINGKSTDVEQPLNERSETVATYGNGEATKQETRNRKQETTPPNPQGVSDERFEAFWRAYPRKTAKDAARKAFEKRKVTPELLGSMLKALESQKASIDWQKDGGQYIPHPTTWLNQGRWQDGEAEQPVSDWRERLGFCL